MNPASQPEPGHPGLRLTWRIAVEVFRKYAQDGGPLIAAAISFFALLSIIPLVLLGVWGLGQFLSSAQAFLHVIDYLDEYLPESSDAMRLYLMHLVHSHRTIGWLGVAGLLWSGSQGFVILELAMNVALRVPRRRSFVESRILGIGMILLAGGMLAISLLITSAITAIRNYSLPVVGWRPGEIPALWSAVGAVVSVLLTILSFTGIYGVVPNTPIPWRTALIAGTTAGLCWEAAKRAVAYYLSHVPAATIYGSIYGPIGGVIALVFWIYYSCVILVLGAELASVLQNIHPQPERLPPQTGRP
jgi:membrane protein